MIMKIPKWGFGMAPLTPNIEKSYRKSIVSVQNFVGESKVVISKDLTDDISKVKGLFNRIKRQDQWDWFTVNMYFDYPHPKDIACIVFSLASLRKAIIDKNDILKLDALTKLIKSRFLIYCDNFLAFDINAESTTEYLYILSRKEQREILKIGMTTRNVQKRVNEINSATGVVFPFSARKVYKIKDARLVEKKVHMLLSPYRIRKDREFFNINFADACSIIEEYLIRSDQLYYGEK